MKVKSLNIVILSFVLVFKCSVISGQPNFNDTSQAYTYWSERGIIEVIFAYMNDYISTVTDSTLPRNKIKDSKSEKEGLQKYEQQFIENINNYSIDEVYSNLNKLPQFLNDNSWKDAEKKVFEPLILNQKEKKQLNVDFFLLNKTLDSKNSIIIPGYNNKMTNWNKSTQNIILKYNESLREIKSSEVQPSVNEDDSNKNSNVDKDKTHHLGVQSFDWLLIVLIGLFSFVLGGFLIHYKIRSTIYKILGDDVETYQRSISQHYTGLFSYLEMVRLLKERKETHKKNASDLQKKLETSKTDKVSNSETKQLSEQELSLSESSKPTNKEDNSTITMVWDLSKELNPKQYLFFSIPESDGQFKIEKGEQSNDGLKFYKIEYESNSNKGELYFISSEQDKRAINRLDSYLKSVCDIENIINADDAVKIDLLKPGKVIKVNDSWVIDPTNKVKIKLR